MDSFLFSFFVPIIGTVQSSIFSLPRHRSRRNNSFPPFSPRASLRRRRFSFFFSRVGPRYPSRPTADLGTCRARCTHALPRVERTHARTHAGLIMYRILAFLDPRTNSTWSSVEECYLFLTVEDHEIFCDLCNLCIPKFAPRRFWMKPNLGFVT